MSREAMRRYEVTLRITDNNYNHEESFDFQGDDRDDISGQLSEFGSGFESYDVFFPPDEEDGDEWEEE